MIHLAAEVLLAFYGKYVAGTERHENFVKNGDVSENEQTTRVTN